MTTAVWLKSEGLWVAMVGEVKGGRSINGIWQLAVSEGVSSACPLLTRDSSLVAGTGASGRVRVRSGIKSEGPRVLHTVGSRQSQ
jgi:hypothetical protein